MTDLLWSLIALQMAMGAFDVLYHHELTGWRGGKARGASCGCTPSATCSTPCCS
jgi:hypothetical protein